MDESSPEFRGVYELRDPGIYLGACVLRCAHLGSHLQSFEDHFIHSLLLPARFTIDKCTRNVGTISSILRPVVAQDELALLQPGLPGRVVGLCAVFPESNYRIKGDPAPAVLLH